MKQWSRLFLENHHLDVDEEDVTITGDRNDGDDDGATITGDRNDDNDDGATITGERNDSDDEDTTIHSENNDGNDDGNGDGGNGEDQAQGMATMEDVARDLEMSEDKAGHHHEPNTSCKNNKGQK